MNSFNSKPNTALRNRVQNNVLLEVQNVFNHFGSCSVLITCDFLMNTLFKNF